VQVRPLGPADVADYLALNQEPDVAGSHFGDPVTADSARQRCWHAEYRWLSGELADCVIAESSTGAFAGTVQLVYREPGTRTGMLGYALLPAFRGRGFATRAVRLVADWADTIGLARLIAGTTPDNAGSRAVLLRAGFEFEALCKAALPARDGTWLDNVQFVRRCLRAKETS
jgi:RimJ/RimL family protein N-acetyltransferase